MIAQGMYGRFFPFARQSATFATLDSFFSSRAIGEWIAARLPLAEDGEVLELAGQLLSATSGPALSGRGAAVRTTTVTSRNGSPNATLTAPALSDGGVASGTSRALAADEVRALARERTASHRVPAPATSTAP